MLTRREQDEIKALTPTDERGLARLLNLNAPIRWKITACKVFALLRMPETLTEEELVYSRAYVSSISPCDWFHGGTCGLRVGDMLLPPRLTGLDSEGVGDLVVGRKDSVFFSSRRSTAWDYAARVRGNIYQVMPIGEVLVDAIALRTSRLVTRYLDQKFVPPLDFCAPQAQIVEVLA